MKRIVTIQDISCVGKCSLTVALPIISAMGIETAIIPTAVLSTHTAFQNFTCHDLTDEIAPISAHWKQLALGFDAIYTGYLASFEQIHQMQRFFEQFRTDGNFCFVDPAMGDNGKLYSGFDQNFAHEMAKLVAMADICVPNLTEACMMLDLPYRTDGDEAYYTDILHRLCDLGAKKAVLTGTSLEPGRLGVMSLDSTSGRIFHYDSERIPASFHGTGDIFSSTCVGGLACGLSLNGALKLAHDYTVQCIRATLDDPTRPWYGVNFELCMPYLLQRLETALQTNGQ